jgi:hypothetical protein
MGRRETGADEYFFCPPPRSSAGRGVNRLWIRIFGFGEVRRVDPEGFPEAAKLDAIVERISVHKVMEDQKFHPRAGVAPNLATCGHGRTDHGGQGLDGDHSSFTILIVRYFAAVSHSSPPSETGSLEQTPLGLFLCSGAGCLHRRPLLGIYVLYCSKVDVSCERFSRTGSGGLLDPDVPDSLLLESDY